MDGSKILSRSEVAAVLADLERRGKRSLNSRLNLIVFRLSCCCGLRAKEIVGLDMGDVAVSSPRSAIRVRKEITKGQDGKRRSRIVPLWWDAGTAADIAAWKQFRLDSGAGKDDPFLCQQQPGHTGKRINESLAAKRWRTAIKTLGTARAKQLSIHCGRHSYCTHALFVGRSLAEVRDAAGHRNISTTSIYLHYLERPGIPDLFCFAADNPSAVSG